LEYNPEFFGHPAHSLVIVSIHNHISKFITLLLLAVINNTKTVTAVTELVQHVSTSSSVVTLAQCYLHALLITVGWHIIRFLLEDTSSIQGQDVE